jgi:NAD(P)H-dependent FMN reductase
VSYGGIGGGLRAVEQLRQLFAELHTVTMRDAVSFHMAWEQFDPSGDPCEPARCNRAATAMLDQLAWWANALRAARAADAARLADTARLAAASTGDTGSLVTTATG